ncbi:hypothetical protein TSACC_22302 [Terrimicrobium sacchariphilum]|uniref:Uncharacterized protein n=1 Tax=Terrimicrobium sacchariphilum TaxID=690879 RepID=A0A146G9D2_TERSA|nr:hypothetical protein [Terrimicrobium sacchariphilum]GAT33882.1 hypothetical protein TSACC_22302 [Terrimicrobium sacchariphilum]
MSRHQHHHHGKPRQQESRATPFHRDKRLIAAVVLMLIGILVYVLTMDESVEPVPAPDAPVQAPANS